MKLSISPEHFLEVQKRGYTIDLIYLLKLIETDVDISSLCEGSVKIDVMRSTLIRKGLISEEEKLTTLGKELLVFMETKIAGKLTRKKVDDSVFALFWNNFPATDSFIHRGKKFSGCRTLRQNKEECKIKLDKILLEGEYSIEEITNAIKFDIENKKEMSFKTGTNKLTFLHNSLTYLNQKDFEPYIELLKQGQEIKQTTNGSTDI